MSLFTRRKMYRTSSGQVHTLFDDMANQPHLLVAGATGSGKSVVVNGIIYNLLHNGPSESQLILIDPKRTELSQYRSVPHCIRYASEPHEIIEALQLAMSITERRYQEMQRRHERTYSGGDVYVIIDELAFLMTSQKKQALPLLHRLGMVARASKVHLIGCTQTVNHAVLPTTLTCNFDSRVALRTATAQQSRMIVGVPGCETFPEPVIEHKACCYYRSGTSLTAWYVPMYSDADLDRIVRWWTSRQCVA